jgi:hypothetical protein
MKMPKVLLFLFLLSTISFPQSISKRGAFQECDQFIDERLRDYFDRNEVPAAQIINNVAELGRWESRVQAIKVGNHTVEWIDDVTANDSQSSVRINGELIRLNDQVTLNAPDEINKFKLDMVGQWDQIKLYEFYEQTIIAISMTPRMCTGLMCGVGAQLWYDIKSKQKTFFGTYRTDSDVRLFRFPRENAYYTLATNFTGDPHAVTTPTVVTYELYKLETNGDFRIQKNARGVNYFIKHTSFPDMEIKGKSVKRRKALKKDTIEQNWPEDVLARDQ